MSVPNVTMAKGGGGGGGGKDFGSGSSLSMVMERSKMEFVMPTPPQQAPKLDDGGSGGDNGKNIHNGGGGGDGDGGDDDDYFGGEGDGEGDGQGGGGGGDGFFRTALPELYDRLTLGAVLQEWYKTVADLPLFIRRAVEMGLFSSAQLVRFLSMDVRPNITRAVSRTLPAEVSWHCVGVELCWPPGRRVAFELLPLTIQQSGGQLRTPRSHLPARLLLHCWLLEVLAGGLFCMQFSWGIALTLSVQLLAANCLQTHLLL